MSDSDAPTPPPPGPENPPPPPSAPPPPAPGGGSAPSASGGSPNALMIALSYLWILAIVPLLTEKDDQDVQWHAKHGLVLFGAEILLFVLYNIVNLATGGFGCFLLPLVALVYFGFFVVRILCIVKGINGDRFLIPGLSNFADSF